MISADAVLDRREMKPGAAPVRALPVATARVLVVDDERAVVDAARVLLSAHGWTVVPATTPAEAVTIATSQPVDVALLDLNFAKGQTSGHEGLELVTTLRTAMPSLPIVVMTAWSSMELALEALKRGARDFIEKPWDASRLVGTLNSQLELTSALRRVSELEAEVRELRNAASGDPAPLADMRLLDVEGVLVKQAMERFRGNISRAARALGLSRSALYRRLERHKIQ
jgi:DNA-binding NtrC family response regulator